MQLIPVTFNTEAKVSMFVYPSILESGWIIFLRPFFFKKSKHIKKYSFLWKI